MTGFNQGGWGLENEKPNILTYVYWNTGSADGRNTVDQPQEDLDKHSNDLWHLPTPLPLDQLLAAG